MFHAFTVQYPINSRLEDIPQVEPLSRERSMKALLLFALLLVSTPAFACQSYNFTVDFVAYDYKTCVDGIKIKQLSGANYRVTFVNYLPGTRIPIDRLNFHFKGQKENTEREFTELHNMLKSHNIGDLEFNSNQAFYLSQRSGASHEFTETVLRLLEEINRKVSWPY